MAGARNKVLGGILAAVLLVVFGAASGSSTPHHHSIAIEGNDELLQSAATFGWPGDGSADDPIRIANATFGPSIFGLRLASTDLHVVIEGNSFEGGYIANGPLILSRAKNILVANNTLDGYAEALTIGRGSEIQVRNNTFHSTGVGVMCYWCEHVVVADNSHSGGVVTKHRFRDSGHLDIRGNNASVSILASAGPVVVEDNDALHIGWYGVNGEPGVITKNRVRGTIIVSDWLGQITDNVLTIESDSKWDDSRGRIELGDGTVAALVRGNQVFGGGPSFGVELGARGNTIVDNYFSGGLALPDAVSATYVDPAGGVTANTFHSPPTPGTNIVGGDTIGGNYWGPGFITPDLDGDGFGDIPYPSLLPDEYPLVLPS